MIRPNVENAAELGQSLLTELAKTHPDPDYYENMRRGEMLYSQRQCLNYIYAGADLSMTNDEGHNALAVAILHEHDDILQPLLGLMTPGEINTPDKSAMTPLHHLAKSSMLCDNLDAFISAGADLEARDAAGNTPFLLTVYCNAADRITALAQAGTDVNAQNNQKLSAFHLAGYFINTKKSVLALINAKASPNLLAQANNNLNTGGSRIDEDYSYLMLKVAASDLPAVSQLITQAGGDVCVRNSRGHDALWFAETFAKPEMIEYTKQQKELREKQIALKGTITQKPLATPKIKFR